MEKSKIWDRGTIVHELSHQIVWDAVEMSTANLLAKFAEGFADPEKDSNYAQNHNIDWFTNQLTAHG